MRTGSREDGTESPARRFLDWTHTVFPDPHGLASFALAGSVLLGYLGLDSSAGPRLFSDSLALEVLGHVWLLLGPLLAVLLAFRSFLEGMPSPLALVTLPLSAFLTILGLVGTAVGLLSLLHAA
jgi:hypothetical protein